ncbi:uncharacterized protein LOC119287050 [Triticum dicoccoides]|uniref:uncharacterized protein LOC119287050 n=1 Tax=Triticum dicoccoides TaxID=85692 RepID=UPI00188FC0D0|nr:uncharacterized protein LOC119287050 [Triticum dicoccoides]
MPLYSYSKFHDCYLVLRQGDPLLLMLFVIFIDVLNTLIQRVVKDGFLQCLTNHHIALSISLFANDIVIFCHLDAQDHGTIHELLRLFLDVLHCTDPMPACGDEAIGDGLSCPITNFPIPYLGLPLSVRQIPSSILQALVDRIAGKFTTWRAGCLKGVKLVLARHIPSTMPVHILLAMVLNPSIFKKIDCIQLEFLWYGQWETSCRVEANVSQLTAGLLAVGAWLITDRSSPACIFEDKAKLLHV